MTNPYTPEEVAELVADTRDYADYMRRVWGEDAGARDDARLFDWLAAALTAVSAERDEARRWAEAMQAQKFEWEGREARARAERDRLHKAITDALAWLDDERLTDDQHIGGARANLRAALDKEGNDDE